MLGPKLDMGVLGVACWSEDQSGLVFGAWSDGLHIHERGIWSVLEFMMLEEVELCWWVEGSFRSS